MSDGFFRTYAGALPSGALDHLEPFDLICPLPGGAEVRVRVVYTDHVFTIDVGGRRVVDPQRLADSRQLPDVLAGLPSRRVFQTWEKRNYVTIAPFDGGAPLHVFFALRRRRPLELRVESAYRKQQSDYLPPRRPNAVRFPMLVQKVLLGQPLKFAPR